jgi:hypothetical protein
MTKRTKSYCANPTGVVAMSDQTWAVDDPAPTDPDLPAHLVAVDGGRVECRECDTPAQQRPVVHKVGCPEVRDNE